MRAPCYRRIAADGRLASPEAEVSVPTSFPPRRSPPRGREVVLAVGPLAAGSLVGLLTNSRGRSWYRALAKPRWTPPDGVFGPVWTILYLLMGIAAALVAARGAGDQDEAASSVDDIDADTAASRRRVALAAFGVQLALNLLWSVVFFGARRARLAAAEIAVLWLALVATILAFVRVRLVSGALLLPYLAWTTFAAALNFEIARRNRGS